MNATPTPHQLNAALIVYVAEAFYQLVVKEFTAWKQEIISNDIFLIADEYYTERYKKINHDFPTDKIVRDTKHCMYIDGAIFTDAKPGTDADRFYTALNKKAIAYGFTAGHKAEEKALLDLYHRQSAFIDATYAIHCLKRETLSDVVRGKLVNTLCDMFAPMLKNFPIEPLTFEYYNERVLQAVQLKTVYTDDEASFTWFQALQKITPVADFLKANIDADEEDIQKFEGVDYILTYTPNCHIYQMKPMATWSYDNFKSTSNQYAFINLHDELIESNQLPTVERALFKHFLQYFNR